MLETFESAHFPWMQAVYGKRVSYENGPIVPGFEHRWTSRSSDLPMKVARLCYPHIIGIGTDDLSDWFRYPWLRYTSSGDASFVPGGLVVQPRCVDGTWWLIAGRIRGRSEGIEGAPDKRHYVQAHYLVLQVSNLGSWVLLDLPNHLVARPDVDGEPTERNSIELNRWSNELLPMEWFETTKKWLLRLLSGQPVAVVDREMAPDRFYFQAILCLGCLPGTIRWRIPIGAGLYPINSDDVAIGHGTAIRTATVPPAIHDLEATATAYLEWLERLLKGVTTLSEVVTKVDDALSGVVALNSVPIPNEAGRIDWRKEVMVLGGIADELNRLQKIRGYIKNGGEMPLAAFTQFRHFKRDAIVAVTDGLADGNQSNRRASQVLSNVLGKDWLPVWRELAQKKGDKTAALHGVAAILGHEHNWECDFKWDWFNEFVSRIDLPEKGSLDTAMVEWLDAMSLGAHGVGQQDQRKYWRQLLVESCNGQTTEWFTNWLKRNRVLNRWLTYDAILDGTLVKVPASLSKDDQQACKEVLRIVQCAPNRQYEPLSAVLSDIEDCFKNKKKQAFPPAIVTMIKDTAEAITEHSKRNRQFAETLLFQKSMRPIPTRIEPQYLDDLANRFTTFSEDSFLRRVIFDNWGGLSDNVKDKIRTHLALPHPYEYILLGDDIDDQPGSRDRWRRSDQQYLEDVIKAEATKSTAKRHTEIVLRVIEKCRISEDLRDFVCQILTKVVDAGGELDSSRYGAFVGLLLCQMQVERLPSLSLGQAIHINEVLLRVSPDPRRKPDLLANVSSSGEMLAYLVGAVRGEAFPSDINRDVIDEILDEIGKHRKFESFCIDQLRRIDVLHKPLWRLFQIHSLKSTSSVSYTERELEILDHYIEDKLNTNFEWVLKIVSRGWPIPSGLEEKIAKVAEKTIGQLEPNDAIELGKELVNYCDSHPMSLHVLKFGLALANEMGKGNQEIRELLDSDWKIDFEKAFQRNLLPTAITAGGGASAVLLAILWGWVLKMLPRSEAASWLRPISPLIIENLAKVAVFIPIATMAIGIIIRLRTVKHGPLDGTTIGSFLSRSYELAYKFAPNEVEKFLKERLRAR